MRYDPQSAPDAVRWLATAEADRLEAVRRHHKKAGDRAGSPEIHAAVHVAVETQLAEGHPAARAAMDRLIAEGLERHEALHAIGSIVATEMFDVVKSRRTHDPEAYSRKLSKLTAASWLAGDTE
jgi:Domain of unknown function (DUF1841)